MANKGSDDVTQRGWDKPRSHYIKAAAGYLSNQRNLSAWRGAHFDTASSRWKCQHRSAPLGEQTATQGRTSVASQLPFAATYEARHPPKPV